MLLRRVLKFLHHVGAAGVLGAVATCLVMIATAPADPHAYAALRQSIVVLHQWVLLPALGALLLSGLLAIAATPAYKDAGWAWMKALLGLAMFEGSLLTIVASGKKIAGYAAVAASGHAAEVAGPLAQALRTEQGGLWIIGAVSLANVVLGVWRPRFVRGLGNTASSN
jgi:hypothetical protein